MTMTTMCLMGMILKRFVSNSDLCTCTWSKNIGRQDDVEGTSCHMNDVVHCLPRRTTKMKLRLER